MALGYLRTMLDEAARAQQRRWFGKSYRLPAGPRADALTDDERDFIARRDSCYLATVNADGWPYVQHRGGPRGFVEVPDEHTLVIPDYPGNRQLITAGNLQGSDRVSLFFMDYPARTRLKVIGRARIRAEHPRQSEPVRQDASTEQPRAERWLVVDVVGYDWNCPRYITPRYSADEIEAAAKALTARVDVLEAENRTLRERLVIAGRLGSHSNPAMEG